LKYVENEVMASAACQLRYRNRRAFVNGARHMRVAKETTAKKLARRKKRGRLAALFEAVKMAK